MEEKKRIIINDPYQGPSIQDIIRMVVDEYRKSPWISVEERLPPERKYVLARHKRGTAQPLEASPYVTPFHKRKDYETER